jgi:class 3 adenylate cyclase
MNKVSPMGNSTRWISIWAAIIVLAAIGGLWYLMDTLEGEAEMGRDIARQEELRQLIPLMEERLIPQNLIRESLQAVLQDVSAISTSTRPLLRSRVRRLFGPGIAFACWTATGQPVFTQGFSHAQAGDLAILARSFGGQLSGDMTSWYEGVRAAHRLFGFEPDVHRMPYSTVGFLPVRLGGTLGWYFVQALTSPQEPLVFRQLEYATALSSRTSFRYPPLRSPKVWGVVVAFVPRQMYTPRLVGRLLGQPELARALSMRYLRADRLRQASAACPPELARLVQAGLARGSRGTVLGQRREVAYLRCSWPTSIEDRGAAPPDLVAIHVRNRPAFPRLARHPVFVAGLFLWAFLLVSGARRRLSPARAHESLIGQGLLPSVAFLGLMAALGPFIGLFWTWLAEVRALQPVARMQAFRDLEQRLEDLETARLVAMSRRVSQVKRWLADPFWRRGPVEPLMVQKKMGGLESYDIDGVYHYQVGKKVEFYKIGRRAITMVAGRSIPLVKGVVGFIARGLKFEPQGLREAGSPGYQSETSEWFMDAFFAGLGSGYAQILHNLAIHLDRVMPFNIFHEVSWSMSSIIYGPDRQPWHLFLINFNRKTIQIVERIEWLLRLPRVTDPIHGFPTIGFMNRDFRRFPLFLPASLSRFPLLQHVLWRSGRDNSPHRMILPGFPALACVVRPQQGTDWVAFALAVLQTGPETSSAGVLPMMILIYPFLMVSLTLWLFNGFFLRPVLSLIRGVETMAEGRYDVELPVLTSDEIGELCLRCNRLARNLQEKEYLRRFMSDLAVAAATQGTDEAVDRTGQGTRVTAAVLFSDIRGFTRLSETHQPEAVVEMLNAYLTQMEIFIESQGGTIEKFIGDAVLALFLPTHGMASPAVRAVRAAGAMRRGREAFNRKRTSAGQFVIETGIGVAFGEVLMGVLGRADGRREFMVTGPTVNRAAAMEKLTKSVAGQIVVCPATHAEILGAGEFLFSAAADEKGQIQGYGLTLAHLPGDRGARADVVK